MSEPFSPDEEQTFDNLWGKFVAKEASTDPIPVYVARLKVTPPPPPVIVRPLGPPLRCCSPHCSNVLGEYRHLIMHGANTAHACSLVCAIKFTKTRVDNTSSHIKVGKFIGVK